MSNNVTVTEESPAPLKYVGSTELQPIPCIVTDMIDQGIIICDGRYSDEECWEGAGIIISPTIPAGTNKTYSFGDPDLQPSDPQWEGQLIVDFSGEDKTAHIIVTKYPTTVSVYFDSSEPNTAIWDERDPEDVMVPLPTTIEFPSELAEYAFAIMRDEEPIMDGGINIGISNLNCAWVGEGGQCESTTSPGIITDRILKHVHFHPPPPGPSGNGSPYVPPPRDTYFECSRANTFLYEESLGINTALPVTIELEGALTEYQFKIIDATHPIDNPLMSFIVQIGVASGTYTISYDCISVDEDPEKCECTTAPGIVIDKSRATVTIHAPVDDLLCHIPDILTAADDDNWTDTQTFLASGITGSLWWHLSEKYRRLIANMAISDHLPGTIRSFSDDNGATWGGAAGVCVANAYVHLMKFGAPTAGAMRDHWSNFYWKLRSWSTTTHPYVTDDNYWLPVYWAGAGGWYFGHYIAHAMAAIQVRKGFASHEDWIVFQYSNTNIRCGDWQLPSDNSNVSFYPVRLSINHDHKYCGSAVTQGYGPFDMCEPAAGPTPPPTDPLGIYTDLVPVESSNLKAAGWTEDFEGGLEIEFLSGSLYLYEGVPESVYDALLAAPSKGKYFWANIRKGTPYTYYKLR